MLYKDFTEKLLGLQGVEIEKIEENITIILNLYEVNGKKQNLGATSHNAVRCALRCFYNFINSK